MSEYLKIDRPNKQFCNGCPCLHWEPHAHCHAINDNQKLTGHELGYKYCIATPPNCPLIEFEDLSCGRCDAELDLWSTFLDGKKVEVENPTLPQSNSHTLED